MPESNSFWSWLLSLFQRSKPAPTPVSAPVVTPHPVPAANPQPSPVVVSEPEREAVTDELSVAPPLPPPPPKRLPPWDFSNVPWCTEP